jgi:hypothetical protein
MKFRLWFTFALLAALSTLAILLPASPLTGGIDRAAAAGPELAIDADIANGGPCATVDSEITVKPGQPFQAALCVKGLTAGIAAFQLDLVYDDSVINAPEVALEGTALDDNPDVNAGNTVWGDGLGTDWSCNILDMGQQPVGDNDTETGPGHGLAQMACWTVTGTSTLGDNEDAGVLAVISFNGAPDKTGDTTIEIARAEMGDSYAQEMGSCNPSISVEMACHAATVHVSGDTIPADQWPTATPATGEVQRPYSPSGVPQGTAAAGQETAIAAQQTAAATAATAGTAAPTKAATKATTGGAAENKEDGEDGDNDWLLPVVIAAAAVVVIGGASLAFYLRRRG